MFPVGRASQCLLRKIFFSPFPGASQRCFIGYFSQCVGTTGNLVKVLILIQQVWCGVLSFCISKKPSGDFDVAGLAGNHIEGNRPYTQLEVTRAWICAQVCLTPKPLTSSRVLCGSEISAPIPPKGVSRSPVRGPGETPWSPGVSLVSEFCPSKLQGREGPLGLL